MQPYYDLIPPPIFAQVSGKPCYGAFGQPSQPAIHLPSLIHGVKTMDLKHDLNLDFQGQHITKQFVVGIH